MGTSWLITGGARSGKSSFAEKLATSWNVPITIVATAEAIDEDMSERIRNHRETRPSEWVTVEEPVDLITAFGRIDGDRGIVVDCVTVWLGNLFHRDVPEQEIRNMVGHIIDVLQRRNGPSVIVSNEVGLGIHPESELGRRYRDCLGRINSQLASGLERTVFMSAGRGVLLQDVGTLL